MSLIEEETQKVVEIAKSSSAEKPEDQDLDASLAQQQVTEQSEPDSLDESVKARWQEIIKG